MASSLNFPLSRDESRASAGSPAHAPVICSTRRLNGFETAMAKKKSQMQSETIIAGKYPSVAQQASPVQPIYPQTKKSSSASKKASEASLGSSLTISRNKHWRYISAFHGPWLQLPPEILETIAQANYLSFRPRQTDPAVLFDLIKIRKLVDEAADLAVRAQNGITSSAVNASRGDGLSGSVLTSGWRDRGNGKLSPERRYRMRELATQKLSQAYRIDEIAASVATMQSASTLDNVASFVLQRNPLSIDGKYVQFFHEKIPSRMMAEYTPLTSLDEVIRSDTENAAYYRTRASVKIFKEDYHGAIRDLTEALASCRLHNAMHKAGKGQLVKMQSIRDESEKRRTSTKDWLQENRLAEEDQPSSLAMQLLFQRGNQYLTLACQNIRTALDELKQTDPEARYLSGRSRSGSYEMRRVQPEPHLENDRRGLELREIIRKNAKRALKDYTSFLSHIDYAHIAAHQSNEDFFGLKGFSSSLKNNQSSRVLGELSDDSSPVSEDTTTLVKYERSDSSSSSVSTNNCNQPSTPYIYNLSELLSSTPSQHLPPFPAQLHALTHREITTFHPLLSETLHSVLLAHCLLQTACKTLARIAHNAARVIRLIDGYPFFLSARSPARSDWSEILRKTEGNWNLGIGDAIGSENGAGMASSWEHLCKPARPSVWDKDQDVKAQHGTDSTAASNNSRDGNGKATTNGLGPCLTAATFATPAAGPDLEQKAKETEAERRNRIRKECILEALGDERVVDDDTFKRAVMAREHRAWSDIETEQTTLKGGSTPVLPKLADSAVSNASLDINQTAQTTAHDNVAGANDNVSQEKRPVAPKDEAYFVGTERADLIARWILEAPPVGEGLSMPRKKGMGNGKKARAQVLDFNGLEEKVHKISVG